MNPKLNAVSICNTTSMPCTPPVIICLSQSAGTSTPPCQVPPCASIA